VADRPRRDRRGDQQGDADGRSNPTQGHRWEVFLGTRRPQGEPVTPRAILPGLPT
jgi:hypothetical protein